MSLSRLFLLGICYHKNATRFTGITKKIDSLNMAVLYNIQFNIRISPACSISTILVKVVVAVEVVVVLNIYTNEVDRLRSLISGFNIRIFLSLSYS